MDSESSPAVRILGLGLRAGVTWTDYQEKVLTAEARTPYEEMRVCLYYRTGAGKTLTSLALVALAGAEHVTVVAPPSTHEGWAESAQRLGVSITTMSHAKFRMKDTKLARTDAVIADEFHMFGGHGGAGWKKLDRLAAGLKAPLILASATPNYNDADRVYCIQHVLDPHSCKGGFIEFVYKHCETEQNPFGRMPIVTGFKNHIDAAHYLTDLPQVYYLPDEVVYTIEDIPVHVPVPQEFFEFGIDRRREKIIASQMEERHALVNHRMINNLGCLQEKIMDILDQFLIPGEPTLFYATHATVAQAMARSMEIRGLHCRLVTGDTPEKMKKRHIADFADGEYSWLIGTATLGTGTDGFDKVCNTLVILDDTDDDAARRQLIGRIMPRGKDTDASKKKVYRIVLS